MKMKEFDLKLAIAGHPLCTREGDIIEDFYYFKNIRDAYPIYAIVNKLTNTHTTLGHFYISRKKNSKDLMLDVSKPWIREPKMGDVIEVSIDDRIWCERIFIKKRCKKGVICVDYNFSKYYQEDNSFDTSFWTNWRWPIEDKLEITVTINGKSVNPSDISEETWNNLKNK